VLSVCEKKGQLARTDTAESHLTGEREDIPGGSKRRALALNQASNEKYSMPSVRRRKGADQKETETTVF